MRLLSRLRVRTRLLVAFGLLMALLLATALLGVAMVRDVHAGLRSVYETRTVPMQRLGEIDAILLSSRISVMGMIDDPTAAGIEATAVSIQGELKRVDDLWQAYLAVPAGDELARAGQDVEAARQAYVDQGLAPVLDALRSGKVFDAKAIDTQRLAPLAQALQQAMAKLMALQTEAAGSEYGRATAMLKTAYGVSAAAAAIGVLLGVVLSGMVTRSITRPVSEAIGASDRMNRGDLSGDIAPGDGDEMGHLLTALSTMRRSLARLVRTVRSNAESVASTSKTLALHSTDLARRTGDHAVSLRQLATSVVDLEISVKHNAGNAATATQSVHAVSGTAREGGALMAQLVETMKQITESSKKIGEIVGRIEAIAFQTNILSLNAAAEASRAGSNGNGFAAVATEVRSLAASSSVAAKEIKRLISDSLARVASGASLVGRAGSTMERIVGGVHDVSQTMEEISAASAEQARNVDQLGAAIKQLEAFGQTNAAAGRHSAGAADSLRAQADHLVDAVSAFRLPDRQEAAP